VGHVAHEQYFIHCVPCDTPVFTLPGRKSDIISRQVSNNNNVSAEIFQKKYAQDNGTWVDGTKNQKKHRGTQRVNL